MSYFDSDLGYDLGYETETIISPTIQAPTQANGQASQVVYRMDGVTVYGGAARAAHERTQAGRARAAAARAEGSEGVVVPPPPAVASGSVAGPTGAPIVPEGYEGHPSPTSRLRGVERSLTTTDTPVDSSAPTMRAGDLAARSSLMERIAGEGGDLASIGTDSAHRWDANARAMFRETYSRLPEDQLISRTTQGPTETNDAFSTRVRNEMEAYLRDDLAGEIQSRYEPADTISPDTARLMAAQAIREHITSPSDYRAGETRDAIFAEADTIPEHSHTTDQQLFHDTVQHERQEFIGSESVRSALIASDPSYYNDRTRGEERLITDAALFMHDRGIENDPEAMHHLRTDDSTHLTASIQQFHEHVGQGPTRTGEAPSAVRQDLMHRAGIDTLDLTGMTPARRQEVLIQNLIQDRTDARDRMHIESTEHIADADRASRETQAQEQREHEVGRAEQDHFNHMGEQTMQSLMSCITNIANTTVNNAQQATGRIVDHMFQTLSQMSTPRAPDPWSAFYAARGSTPPPQAQS